MPLAKNRGKQSAGNIRILICVINVLSILASIRKILLSNVILSHYHQNVM